MPLGLRRRTGYCCVELADRGFVKLPVIDKQDLRFVTRSRYWASRRAALASLRELLSGSIGHSQQVHDAGG